MNNDERTEMRTSDLPDHMFDEFNECSSSMHEYMEFLREKYGSYNVCNNIMQLMSYYIISYGSYDTVEDLFALSKKTTGIIDENVHILQGLLEE